MAWDQANPYAFSLVSDLATRPPAGTEVVAPGHDKGFGSLLDDQVVPGFERADLVLVMWSATDPLWVAFQAGLASGLAKRMVVVAPTMADADAAEGAPVTVDISTDAGQLRDHIVWASVRRRPKRVTVEPGLRLLLCPTQLPEDKTMARRLEGALTGRSARHPSPKGSSAPGATDVVWVVTPYSVDPTTGAWSNLSANLANAYEAGRCYGAVCAQDLHPLLTILRVGSVRPVTALEHMTLSVADANEALHTLGASQQSPRHASPSSRSRTSNASRCSSSPCRQSRRSEACGHVSPASTVRASPPCSSRWRSPCSAAGGYRRSVLGCWPAWSGRLPRVRLRRPRSRGSAGAEPCPRPRSGSRWTMAARGASWCCRSARTGSTRADSPGRTRRSGNGSPPPWWSAMAATRNISYAPLEEMRSSPQVQRQLTLFDPKAEIVSVGALTRGGAHYRPQLETVARLTTRVLDEPERPFRCRVNDENRLVFEREGAELESVDLPDGFRSVLAILADIAAAWHDLHPGTTEVDPKDITGIVLVDELDLHLHASLQRTVVPRLRAALPRVQWIITTHSPFVVASFDQTELRLLDRAEEGGIRPMDRQILTFTANEVYDWLLGASPVSEAGEKELAAPGDRGTLLLYQTPNRDEKAAKRLVERQEELLQQLGDIKA